VVGVIGAVIIIYIAMKILRRRSRMRDEEEEDYFNDKYAQEPNVHASPSHNDSMFNLASATATMPARQDAYPDRTVHYGSEQAPHDFVAPQHYDYPPGTAYAAAASGSQYQYTGYESASPTGSAHPFADPRNASRPNAAPPVSQPYTQAVDAYGGIDTGYAQ
jgi:hypothetical protein